MKSLRRSATLPACLALLGAACAAHADRLIFRNGHTMDGVVVQETERQVVFSSGAGSMTFARGQIARIERGAPEANAQLVEQSRRQNFLHPDNVPPGEEALAAAVRNVEEERRLAVSATRAAAADARAEAEKQKELDAVEQERVNVSKELRDATPGVRVAAYNALVARLNGLGADLTVRHAELDQLAEHRARQTAVVASYLAALQRGEDLLAERQRQAPPGDAGPQAFLADVARKLAGQEKEFQALPVATARGGHGSVATVTVNGRKSGRFLVDTGAEMVALGRAFAAELGLEQAHMPDVRIRVADGTETLAKGTSLQSVRAGDAVAENVQAVIMNGEVGPGVDGLLGMSFLKHFLVRMDGATGKLELLRFAPKP